MNEELVLKELETHEKRLNDHGDRLDNVEKRDAARDVKIDNLCDKIASLTKATYGLVVSIFMTLVGFFIWYIQNIPR